MFKHKLTYNEEYDVKTFIKNTNYKDIQGISLENEQLRAIFLPNHGAKLASLFHKETLSEFLVQNQSDAYATLEYGGDYVSSECSGFDDMFPTIDSCVYDEAPWSGTVMPDHGEVCSLDWHSEIEGDAVHMWVYGVRFPYRMDKWAELKGNRLEVRYLIQNLSGFDFNCIYAAHVMINSQLGGKLGVSYPANSPITCMFSQDSSFMKPQNLYTWPHISQDKADCCETTADANTYKFYFNDKDTGGRCSYRYPNGLCIEMIHDLPYLGIWVNNGAFKGYQNVAFEPCTGMYDTPIVAREKMKSCVLKRHQKLEFGLTFVIS